MTFGDVALDDALGAILAHSIQLPGKRLRKGTKLAPADIDRLKATGRTHVTAAQLGTDDLHEDIAAEVLSSALARPDITAQSPFTGRANLHAETAGILRVNKDAINAFNAIDPAITIATLPDYARVSGRQMIATVKIIPYGVPKHALDQARATINNATLKLHAFRPSKVQLIITRLEGQKESLVQKGITAVQTRVEALGLSLMEPLIIPHEQNAVASALNATNAPLKLILGASATSDENDICPAALRLAGGTLTRFGMPVDPGNLLFFGDLGASTVIGLPGCARSPALNGADWVLERIAAGIEVTANDIAAMGVGGLLKEIATRPQPRMGNARVPQKPRVAIILLAAGASRRMRGADKLIEPVNDIPLIRHAALTAKTSSADSLLIVLDKSENPAREAALGTIDDAKLVYAKAAKSGMAASLRAGMEALDPNTDAVIVALADMPDITNAHFDKLIAAFDPSEGRSIIRATAQDGTPGHPVLFGKRFFESLSAIEGDQGAKALIAQSKEYLVDVPTPGMGATTDLDTPEAWANWRAAQK